uniref:Serine peptidase inhibitor, Kunitz type 1 b n=1 Tax=Tetraodon nigroviridis TaxID=99883 RepID=H3CGS7_TETNG
APPQAACSGAFRPGPEDFVLDSEDAVRGGAVLLDSAQVPSAEACQRACCERARCNLALLELRGRDAAGARNHTCVLFNCIHRNRFVCRFANQDGFRSFISNSASLRHLQGPTGGGGQAPPIADAGPDLVVQPGTVVLLNGIESVPLGGAHITAYRWTLLRGNDSVSMEPTDLPDQVSVSGLQAGSYTFQLTVTDSKQQSDAANVSVLVLSPQLSSTFCRAPVKVGPCRAAFPRWWFNASTGQCQPFTFGGCKGNSNNYLTEEDCVSACRGVAGTGAQTTHGGVWSLCSPSQLSCGSGCCLHKSLECDGVKHCSDGSDENHCSELNQTFSHLLEIEVDKKKARCSEPPYTGPCRASFPRWYYNPMDMRCVRFTGGCGANGNNFEEESRCESSCSGITASGIQLLRAESADGRAASSSGHIALAVLLAVAILALLAVLSFCFLKSRRGRYRRSQAAGPAHVVLSEQDTLVYNRTTEPM